MSTLKKIRIADGEPDIRGWAVFTSHGREIGEVGDLLVDTTEMEVVMLDVDLRHDDRRTLAPIRAAWVDRPNSRVVIDAAEIQTEEDLPILTHRKELSDDDADEFNRRYSRAYGEDELMRRRVVERHNRSDDDLLLEEELPHSVRFPQDRANRAADLPAAGDQPPPERR